MWQKEQVIEEFRKNGKRITEQRKMLLDVILEEGLWINCKDIYYEAKKRDPKLGMATVYRTISVLEEVGILARSYQYSFLPEEKEKQKKNSSLGGNDEGSIKLENE